MKEKNKTTNDQSTHFKRRTKIQDKPQEKVQQRYCSEFAKYQEQILRVKALAGQGKAA